MAVRKVNPEIGPIRSPFQAPLHRALEPLQTFRYREPVSLGLSRGGGGGGVPGPPGPLRDGSDGASVDGKLIDVH